MERAETRAKVISQLCGEPQVNLKTLTRKVRVDELEAGVFAKAPPVGAESRTGFQPTQRFGGWQTDFIDDVKDSISTENEHSELDREMITQIH